MLLNVFLLPGDALCQPNGCNDLPASWWEGGVHKQSCFKTQLRVLLSHFGGQRSMVTTQSIASSVGGSPF